MHKTEKLVLIEGEFTHEEANDIIFNQFKSKLNFHNLKNLSSQERFGIEDETAKTRIPALKKEMEKFKTILSESIKHNQKLRINSVINIEYLNE